MARGSWFVALGLVVGSTACSQAWWPESNSESVDKPLWLASSKEKVRIGEPVTFRLRAQMADVRWRLTPIAQGGYVLLRPVERDLLTAMFAQMGQNDLLAPKRYIRQNYIQEKYYKTEILKAIEKFLQIAAKDYADAFASKMRHLRGRYYKSLNSEVPALPPAEDEKNKNVKIFVKRWRDEQKERLPVVRVVLVELPSLTGLLSGEVEELGHWQLRFFKPGKYRPLAPAFFQRQKNQSGKKATGSAELLALGIYADKIKVVNPFESKEKPGFQALMPWQGPPQSRLSLLLLGLVAVVALVLVGLFFFSRWQKSRTLLAQKAPRPSVEYFDGMGPIKRDLARRDSNLMDVTVEISRLLRRFVERSLPILAMEMDAEELVRSLQSYGAMRESTLAKAGLAGQTETVAKMLRYLDSIKFAKADPDRHRLTEIVEELNIWVQRIAKYTEETSVAA